MPTGGKAGNITLCANQISGFDTTLSLSANGQTGGTITVRSDNSLQLNYTGLPYTVLQVGNLNITLYSISYAFPVSPSPQGSTTSFTGKGNLDVSTTGNVQGGTIDIQCGNLSFSDQQVTLNTSATNANSNGHGGLINIFGSQLSTTGHIALLSNGGGTGTAGSVLVNVTGQSNLVVSSSGAGLGISARGGRAAGSTDITASVSTQGNLTVDGNSIDVSVPSLAPNNGAAISLSCSNASISSILTPLCVNLT